MSLLIFLRDISDLSQLEEGNDNELIVVEPSEAERQTIGQYFRGLPGDKLFEAMKERLEEELYRYQLEDTELVVIFDEIKKRLERYDVLDATERMKQASTKS